MHTMIFVNPYLYKEDIQKVLSDISLKHKRACYISFSDPYHLVIELLENASIENEKFVIIDASSDTKEIEAIDRKTFVLPIGSLFNVYIFLRDLIRVENIEMILLDSLSALIRKHSELPLKDMMTNLLLEVGALRCSSSILVLQEHSNHEVVDHLSPLIAKNVFL